MTDRKRKEIRDPSILADTANTLYCNAHNSRSAYLTNRGSAEEMNMDKEKKRKSNIAGEAFPNATQDPCLDPSKASHRLILGQNGGKKLRHLTLSATFKRDPSFVRGNTHRHTLNTVQYCTREIYTDNQEGFRLALSPTR
jgi:hypothetical protein